MRSMVALEGIVGMCESVVKVGRGGTGRGIGRKADGLECMTLHESLSGCMGMW